MKTKIAVTVALCALFVVVPSATPKGIKPAGLQWSVLCSDAATGNDTCAVTITGVASGIYALEVTSSCGGSSSNSVNPNSGTVSTSAIVSDCPAGTLTFNLVTAGEKRRDAGVNNHRHRSAVTASLRVHRH
jgi:hypothetical protein